MGFLRHCKPTIICNLKNVDYEIRHFWSTLCLLGLKTDHSHHTIPSWTVSPLQPEAYLLSGRRAGGGRPPSPSLMAPTYTQGTPRKSCDMGFSRAMFNPRRSMPLSLGADTWKCFHAGHFQVASQPHRRCDGNHWRRDAPPRG